jgi:hypothetical protein
MVRIANKRSGRPRQHCACYSSEHGLHYRRYEHRRDQFPLKLPPKLPPRRRLAEVAARYQAATAVGRHKHIHEFQGADVMETVLIALGVIAGAAIVFWLFVIEPRRKIYDRD